MFLSMKSIRNIQKFYDFLQLPCIYNVLFLQPSFASDTDAVPYVVQSINIVCIGIDADFDSLLFGVLTQTPIEVEPQGMGVYLYHLPIVCCNIDDVDHVDGISVPFQQQATRGMAEHCYVF